MMPQAGHEFGGDSIPGVLCYDMEGCTVLANTKNVLM